MTGFTQKLLAQSIIPGQYSVQLFLCTQDNTYAVVYGMSGREGLSRKAAVREYRECVDHQMECAGIMFD